MFGRAAGVKVRQIELLCLRRPRAGDEDSHVASPARPTQQKMLDPMAELTACPISLLLDGRPPNSCLRMTGAPVRPRDHCAFPQHCCNIWPPAGPDPSRGRPVTGRLNNHGRTDQAPPNTSDLCRRCAWSTFSIRPLPRIDRCPLGPSRPFNWLCKTGTAIPDFDGGRTPTGAKALSRSDASD